MTVSEEGDVPRRVGFPAGVPAWVDINSPDQDAAAGFYQGLFGWRFEERTPPGSMRRYLVASLGSDEVAAIGSLLARPSGAPAWNTHVAVDDADGAADRVREAGGRVLDGPAEAGAMARVALCADPASATFGFWQPGSIKGAESVNAPNTWNFSELNVVELDAARTFYGAVFGWEIDVSADGIGAGMVRLPGYADFLEQFDPGLRVRHRDFGAPPGFSDCVAWFIPVDVGDIGTTEAAAHWSVTFSVADADYVAERARVLGGSVEVEPYDVAPTRAAVLRDPAGARFTVSAFKPG